jgi:hypothetical protein
MGHNRARHEAGTCLTSNKRRIERHRRLPRWKYGLLHYGRLVRIGRGFVFRCPLEVVQKPVNHRGKPGGEHERRFLKCLVAFELKVGPFEPEHAGQMDF